MKFRVVLDVEANVDALAKHYGLSTADGLVQMLSELRDGGTYLSNAEPHVIQAVRVESAHVAFDL